MKYQTLLPSSQYWRYLGLAAVTVLSSILATQIASATPLPGVIISQDAPQINTGITEASTVQSITYHTRDSFGNPTISSGIIALPKGSAPVGGWPVVAYAHSTVGMADFDAPSLTDGGVQIPRYNAWLKKGYAVAASDFAGLGTPGVMQYLGGKATAYNVIDSVRALRNAFPTAVSNAYASVGWSQGGHASLFVGRYAGEYAPELNLRGTIANGPATNIERFTPLAGPNFPQLPLGGFVTFMVYTIAGVNAAYPEVNVSQYLTPLGIELMNATQTTANAEMHQRTKDMSLGQLFSKSIDNPDHLALVREYMGVPTSGYSQPVHVIQGITDTTVPAALTLVYTTEMLANFQPVSITNYPSDHYGTYQATIQQELNTLDRYLGAKRSILGINL